MPKPHQRMPTNSDAGMTRRRPVGRARRHAVRPIPYRLQRRALAMTLVSMCLLSGCKVEAGFPSRAARLGKSFVIIALCTSIMAFSGDVGRAFSSVGRPLKPNFRDDAGHLIPGTRHVSRKSRRLLPGQGEVRDSGSLVSARSPKGPSLPPVKFNRAPNGSGYPPRCGRRQP